MMPFLLFVALATVDYGRVVRRMITMTHCAHAGALYASDPALASALEGAYEDAEAFAMAGAVGLNPPLPRPTVTAGSQDGLDYVEVNFQDTFRTLIRYPGIPESISLSRTVRMLRTPT